MSINISNRKIYHGEIYQVSSELNSADLQGQLLSEKSGWCSKKSESINYEYIILDYKDIININQITIEKAGTNSACFPENFRIETSPDAKNWQAVTTERDVFLQEPVYNIDLDLISLRYLKIFITRPQKKGNKYYVEIGNILAGISGLDEVKAGKAFSYENTVSKLFDNNKETFWETEHKKGKERESINIDLKRIYCLNFITISSINEELICFPEYLYIEAGTDKKIWFPIITEKNFKTEKDQTYLFNFNSINARYIRIEMDNVKISEDIYTIKLNAINIFAAVTLNSHTHFLSATTPHASIFQPGISRLAKDGEDTPGSIIQANDRRLKEATTLFKGIMQFAESGDLKPGLAVQASDERLKPATELQQGIVRLAYNRENKEKAVVQGNDSRLQEATETSYGIVKLCPDSSSSEMGVVKGNDARLKEATIKTAGICLLAKDGEKTSGKVVQANDKRLKNATTTSKGIVELAEDGEIAEGIVVQSNDKRLKDATTTTKGIIELAEDGEISEGVVVQGNDKRLKDATTTTKGIVELAEDGEDKSGVAVQGNDWRLKKATTSQPGTMRFANNKEETLMAAVQSNDQRLKPATITSRGIVELAEDGETSESVVVQGNDRRLKDATTTTKGIVELGEDGETSKGVVVQGSDKRLKDATTRTKGIVELAEDGEDKSGVAVQGNDKRLKNATTNVKGIVELAEDGENKSGVAVQGNDKRLKDASETHKGIVQFAQDSEETSLTAVQGNDKRLKPATTASKGIVELAENGENKSGVVVQGNDKRLQKATTENYGIIILGKNGGKKSGTIVQSDDQRLFNARTPLPHEHAYAPIKHDINSHTGTIQIIDDKSEPFQGITPPSLDSSIIYAKNQAKKSGNIGIIGISDGTNEKARTNSYGVLGHSSFVGIRGQSPGKENNNQKGAGILGVSRFGAGGVFCSEHDYSLVVDGFGNIDNYDNSVKLIGNGQALAVNGSSEFNGPLKLFNNQPKKNKFPSNIIEMFEVNDVDYISPGDLLIVTGEGNSILGKTHSAYDKAVIGVVAGNSAIIINNSGKEEKLYPIALTGKILCKVDARQTPVKPGDLIVTSENPGCGMKGVIDDFSKIGTVIGKALAGLESGMDVIPVFIYHN